MISVIADALFARNNPEHTRFNVYFESIDNIRAKYCVVQYHNGLSGELCPEFRIRQMFPVQVAAKQNENLEVTITYSEDSVETVKTDYMVLHDVAIETKVYVDTTMVVGQNTHVCRM